MERYSIGARVSQTQYGAGTVTVANQYHVIVDFDDHGRRTFSAALVRLEPSTTLAPVRRARAPRRTKAAIAAAAAAAAVPVGRT